MRRSPAPRSPVAPLPNTAPQDAPGTSFPLASTTCKVPSTIGHTKVLVTLPSASPSVVAGPGYSLGTHAQATVTILDNDPIVDIRVTADDDDAEEALSGVVDSGSSDLEMVYDARRGDQLVGIRFVVPAERAANINAAWLQFHTDEPTSVPTQLTITGEASDDALPFSESSNDISNRPVTTVSVDWAPPAWNVEGESGPDQRSPDLSAIVQEVIGRPGWTAGSGLVFIVSGSGQRVAESFASGVSTA